MPIIQISNLSKAYRLGVINHGMLYKDIQSWWARVRGKEDPNSVIGMHNQEQMDGEDRFWALKDIDFEVNQGDRIGIIGKNGAGKSTLLKILSRVTAPTKGSVKVKGRIASLLEVGTGFHPELTGRENVFLNGAILGMSKQEIHKKFDEIVDFAGIEKFIDTPVKRYSSGMYVRLAFAVAAHLEPEILVVDEVLAVGDAEFQKKAIGKMEDVSKGEGRTVLFVSHNMGAVSALCDRGLCISDGKIIFKGEVTEVINHYLSSLYKADAYVEFEDDLKKSIQIKSVKLMDLQQNITSSLDMLKPFRVLINYQVNEDVTGVVISVNIFSSYGESIIATADYDIDRTKLGKRKKGVYTTFVDIPGELLNSGTYSLVVGISIPGKVIYDRKEVMSFELYDSGSFIVDGGGEVRRNSLLLIGLPWY